MALRGYTEASQYVAAKRQLVLHRLQFVRNVRLAFEHCRAPRPGWFPTISARDQAHPRRPRDESGTLMMTPRGPKRLHDIGMIICGGSHRQARSRSAYSTAFAILVGRDNACSSGPPPDCGMIDHRQPARHRPAARSRSQCPRSAMPTMPPCGSRSDPPIKGNCWGLPQTGAR